MHRRFALQTAALIVVGGLALAGCHLGTKTVIEPSKTIITTTKIDKGGKPRIRHRAYPVLATGHSGTLTDPQQHAAITITVDKPSVSTTRLSSSYGYPPEFGHYVTFRLTIENPGEVPVDIHRLDFYVVTPGTSGATTTNDGDSPVSGSPRQLDTTELEPHQRVTNDLTFDVKNPSGRLYYAPGGTRELAWTF